MDISHYKGAFGYKYNFFFNKYAITLNSQIRFIKTFAVFSRDFS